MLKIIYIILLSSLILAGCSPKIVVPARLYEMHGGKVINANFNFSGTTHGKIDFSFPSGEKFTGEYFTTRGGSVTTGHIYGSVWNNNNNNNNRLSFNANSSSRTTPTEYVGTAIVKSDIGNTITCEYITNTSRFNPHGHGACKDSQGTLYKLMF